MCVILEGVQIIKMATLAGKKLSFRPKNGYSDVFKNKCIKLLRNFTSALRDSQTYKIVAHLNLKGAPTIKKATFSEKKSSFERGNVKKMGFLRVFTHYCTESLRNFTIVLRWCSNLQDGRLFDWARCASNKMDNFIGRKISSGPKNFKKWVFWGFHTLLY